MKTKIINLYQFSELSEKAKEKAIEKLWDINLHPDWAEYILENALLIGLKIDEFDLDRHRNAKGKFLVSACDTSKAIKENHGKESTTFSSAFQFDIDLEKMKADFIEKNKSDLDYDLDLDGHYENELDVLEYHFLKSLLEDYSIMLQKEYEHLQSKEAIIESIEANEYDFLEDGSLVFNLQTVLEIEKEAPKVIPFSLEVTNLLASLSRKTDRNDHNGSALEFAKFLKVEDSEKAIISIMVRHEKLGHMVPVWIEERTVEVMRLLEIAEFQLGKEIAKKISSCF